ncbi:MAG: SLC13 family permease, partial [Candidatus Thorarchaeota archaeon]
MEPVGILILAIFIFTMIIILSEKINETATALFAMCASVGLLIVTNRMDFETFILLIEWDTILFVTAMMIVVSVGASSGVFQYIALHLAQRTGGEPKSVFTSFMAFVFVISLFFDPLPTMLIMGPLTVEVCRAIDMDYRVLLISQVIISNFASFPSIVGSVSNLVISSWANIEAGYLFLGLLPLSLLLFPITMAVLSKYYSVELAYSELDADNPLMMIKPTMMIKSRRDFYMSSIGMGIL